MAGCHSVHLATMTDPLLAELRLAFLQLPDHELLHWPFLGRNRRILGLVHDGDEAAVLTELEGLPALFRSRCCSRSIRNIFGGRRFGRDGGAQLSGMSALRARGRDDATPGVRK